LQQRRAEKKSRKWRQDKMSEAPRSLFTSPKQFIGLVIASFAVPIVGITLIVQYVDNMHRTGAGTDAMSVEAVTQRIAPFAQVTVRDANAPRVYKTGEEVFKAVCTACHTAGVAGAPKFGNAGDWAPRIAQGYDTLLKTALAGKGAMPARGGTSPDDYSDYEIGRAIVYMVNGSGGKLAEPAAPAAQASGAAANAGASGAATVTATAATATTAASGPPAATPVVGTASASAAQ
jgi:cytochrome c5